MSPVWGNIPPVSVFVREKISSGHPDWWKISVFHQEEYWALARKTIDQELKVCSPLVQIIGCTCGCGSNCECTKESNCGCKCWEKK